MDHGPRQMHSGPLDFPSSGEKRYFGRETKYLEYSFVDREQNLYRFSGEHMKRGNRAFEERNKATRHGGQAKRETAILEPHENDVCLGRGGTANKHSGNEKLRQLARLQSEKYRASSKKAKSTISRLLVKQMQELDPPARYVAKRAISLVSYCDWPSILHTFQNSTGS
jgi:hypothetical protein